MPHFIKTGYWEKLSKAPKGYLNLDQFTDKREAIDISHMPFKPGSVGEKVSFKKENYQGQVDMIIPGVLELTRGNNQGLYNAALQTGWNSPGPTNTQWSSQNIDPDYVNWGPLENVEGRTFGTWNQSNNTPNYGAPYDQVGEYRVLKETTTGRIWLIKFTEWTPGGAGGGFAYDRWEILQSVTFQRPTGDENVIDKISDGVHIARQNITGYSGEQILYNTIGETEPRPAVSPVNVRWNTDYTDSRTGYSGFGDLSNLERRVYQDFYDSFNNIDLDIVGKEIVMHDLTTDLYYKVVFSSWEATGGGGAFEYTRTVIPQSLPVRFGDGSVQTTAAFGSGGGGGASIFIPGSGTCSSIRCGVSNTASASYSAALGGCANSASSIYSTILNGATNVTSACYSNILGGYCNTTQGCFNHIGNGWCNTTSGKYSMVFNGYCNVATGSGYHVVLVGAANNILSSWNATILNAYGSTITGSSVYSFIGTGNANTVSSNTASAILSGTNNTVSAGYSLISHGRYNTISGTYSTMANGCRNILSSSYSFTGSGIYNCQSGGFIYGLIGSGAYNKMATTGIGFSNNNATIVNGSDNTINDGTLGFIGNGSTNIICCSIYGTILNGELNNMCGINYAFIGNGYGHNIYSAGEFSSIVNGVTNAVLVSYSFIGGGALNNILGGTNCYSSIVGGCSNSINQSFSGVLNGSGNSVVHAYAGVSGCGITTALACAFHANRLVLTALPTSAAGLPSGAVWRDAGAANVLKIVP